TGTPVENHLNELWSLFRFLNPGLLGSRKGFERRFAEPSANRDARALETLAMLIRPFMSNDYYSGGFRDNQNGVLERG
ncbi:MAG: hypothetical protein GY719_13515, partial [bacterium]|nr:hypothetical protein [bacterium]